MSEHSLSSPAATTLDSAGTLHSSVEVRFSQLVDTLVAPLEVLRRDDAQPADC